MVGASDQPSRNPRLSGSRLFKVRLASLGSRDAKRVMCGCALAYRIVSSRAGRRNCGDCRGVGTDVRAFRHGSLALEASLFAGVCG